MKKIFALIISLLFILQISFVYAEETATLPQSPEMFFATSMGLIEEDADQVAPLTRIELASVFYKILMPSVEPGMDGSVYFSDVDIDGSAYADFVHQCGIMSGGGNGKFEPDSHVTYAQLLKTFVTFLGYEEMAKAQGGYPYGYVLVANSIGLIGSVPPNINSEVTVHKLAETLYIATNIPLMERITFSSEGEKYKVADDTDYLKTYMGITRVRGIVSANYLIDLEDNAKLSYGQIKLGDKIFFVTEKSVDIINNLGCKVDIYVKDYENDTTPAIVYYELYDSNSTTVIDGEDVIGINSGYIKYLSGEKELSAKIASNTKVIYNGSVATSYDNTTINPFKNSCLEGNLTLIDNNRDKVYDVVLVDAYSTYVVKNVVNNVIFNEFIPEEIVDLGADFKDGNIEITNVIGQPIMLSKIESGDIINVSRNLSGEVKRIVVTIDTFSGILDEISYSENVISVDGYSFETSKNLFTDKTIEVGDKITLYFNKSGKVCDIRVSDSKYRIGYIADFKIETGISKEYKLWMFTAGGSFEELTFAKKVMLSDTGEVVLAAAAFEALPSDSFGPERQPVLYTLNDDGDINWIDWCKGTTPRDGLYMMEGFDGKSQTLYYKSSQYNFGSKIMIDASTVIFNVPKDNKADDFENYYIETTSYYGGDGDKTIDFTAYGVDENGSPCAAILVDKDGVKTAAPSSNDIFVVDEISIVINDENEQCYKITGWDYTSGMKSVIIEKSKVDAVYPSKLPKRGDIVQTRTVNGKVSVIQNVFDFDTKKFRSGTNPSTSKFEADLKCIYGDVIYNDGKFIRVRVEGTSEIYALPLTGAKFVEIDFSYEKDGVLSVANVNNLLDTKAYPSHSSKVVIRMKKGSLRTVVIYNGLGGETKGL